MCMVCYRSSSVSSFFWACIQWIPHKQSPCSSHHLPSTVVLEFPKEQFYYTFKFSIVVTTFQLSILCFGRATVVETLLYCIAIYKGFDEISRILSEPSLIEYGLNGLSPNFERSIIPSGDFFFFVFGRPVS